MRIKIAFLGIQGSGKGTQAFLLSQKIKLPLIIMGDIFRKKAKEKSFLGKKIKSIIEKGEMVPDKIAYQILKNELSKRKYQRGAILDGYPRNLWQAKILEKTFPLNFVFFLKISSYEVLRRLGGRRLCPKCGKIFHLVYSPPKNNMKCDRCRIKLIQRSDDKRDIIQKRISLYKNETLPLIKFYKRKKILLEINGEKSIKEVHQEILKKLKKALKEPPKQYNFLH